ncbi:short-chain dehydrogenase [Virgibacillus indicus]|uniref:Short-chain dehydrogenase n=1 Tax=Virgibacillus indicus TaxID=2024554 RepID=A0A265NDW1_9BACI|nr:short-chain dehydrogenase [Virgibacillus indicus]OZU89649.1 short-chain dehydrogenase [Virgibacillus indicus]
MKHALVVGGTGMLSGVSLWLLESGFHVSIIARNAERMESLVERSSFREHITPILVDYRNDTELKEKVNIAMNQLGNIDMVIAWIHSNSERALQLITKEVSYQSTEWELFHILGSSSELGEIKKEVHAAPSYSYYQIQLGYVDEESNSRWLTNKEISDGVIEAIIKKDSVHIIGQIEPWEKRP